MTIPKRLKNIAIGLLQEHWVNALMQIGEVHMVGGCVRDAFRDDDIKDIDLIIEGPTLNQIKLTLEPYGKVNIEGDSFAVVKFRPKGHEGEDFDISVPRVDRKIGEGHKGFDVQTEGVTLMDDLERRDFTINAMAFHIETGKLIDPFDGSTDLRKGILKAVDDIAFVDDPLRILRGIQFAARFDFKIEPITMELMKKHSHLIKEITGERIFDEFKKIINKHGDTQIAFDLLDETGVDRALFGQKGLHFDKGLNWLDEISFFWTLGILGTDDPAKFAKKRLKCGNDLEKGIRTLDNILFFMNTTQDEEDLRFLLFKAFNHAPAVMDTTLLPDIADDIALQMRTLQIPHNWDDIQIDGDDVKEISGISEGPEIGFWKEQILRDALMNRFHWSDRESSLEYLKNLLHG